MSEERLAALEEKVEKIINTMISLVDKTGVDKTGVVQTTDNYDDDDDLH